MLRKRAPRIGFKSSAGPFIKDSIAPESWDRAEGAKEASKFQQGTAGANHISEAPSKVEGKRASPADFGVSKSKLAPVTWSAGVPFYPPSEKYWRIGNKWYDFTDFLDKHPGGRAVLLDSRDRFEDATFVFESHHHDYTRARAIIRKYEVTDADELKLLRSSLRSRPSRAQKEEDSGDASYINGASPLPDRLHFDSTLDKGLYPNLLGDDAFYSVLRKRVTAHLKSVGHKDGGPTAECIGLFFVVLFAYSLGMYFTYSWGSFKAAFLTGVAASWLGGFGHNWVHQPRFKLQGWAILSLDLCGFSSEAWYRDHNLQHHMYTNTPWDNHFRGTDPFLVTDPTVERNFIQRYVTPFINPVLLCFGVYANYFAHTVELLCGRENFSVGKLFLPLHFALMISRWGWVQGFSLVWMFHSVIGLYYFTMALMNHNAEHTMNVKSRNASRDWGEAQLHSSADWGVNMSFLQAGIYLWLNYHTVHHCESSLISFVCVLSLPPSLSLCDLLLPQPCVRSMSRTLDTLLPFNFYLAIILHLSVSSH